MNKFSIGFNILLLLLSLFSYAQQKTFLEPGQWVTSVKTQLEDLIFKNAHQGKKVIFDFDNTIICRDIGEATFAAMAEDKKLKLDVNIHPVFTFKDKTYGPQNNVLTYYEKFSMASEQIDPQTPYVYAYAWLTQIMAGVSPGEIIYYSAKAYNNGIASKDLSKKRINGYLRPFFYPEMVDLAGVLLKNGYEVYVISASNVWTVRWMVEHLNKLIQKKHGKNLAIVSKNVIGVSTLLLDERNGKLYKDTILVKNNKAYANLESKELSHYKLTNQTVYPVTGYFGKVANIFQYVTTQRPFLICGDSPNDFPMLNWARNRLFITRLEKLNYQKKLLLQMKKSLPGKWLLQPTLYKKSPGFLSSQKLLDTRLKGYLKSRTAKTVTLLKGSKKLKGF